MLDPTGPDKMRVDAWRVAHSYDLDCLGLSDEEVLSILKKEDEDAFAAKRFEALFGVTSRESVKIPRRAPNKKEIEYLSKWQQFIGEVFRINLDFKTILIPNSKTGLDALIVVPQELALPRIIQVLGACIPIKRNLDIFKIRSARRDLGTYATYASCDTEPSETFRGISAKTVIASGIIPMNLEERLLLDAYLTWRTKSSIMDLSCDTLCAGSIDADKNAIRVGRDEDGMIIDSQSYGVEDDNAAIREVVG